MRLKSDNNMQYKASCVKNSKEEEFLIFHIFTFICLTTEEEARKTLHSVCCTANNVVLISLRERERECVCVCVCVCVTRGKKVVITFITNVITFIDIDQTVVIFYLYLIFLRV